MDVKLNTTNNHENLWVCSAHWCIIKPLPSMESLISRNAKEVSEISQVYLKAG